jgi:hypothetical protein
MRTEPSLSSPTLPEIHSEMTQRIEPQLSETPPTTKQLAGLLVPRNIRLIIHYSRTAYA